MAAGGLAVLLTHSICQARRSPAAAQGLPAPAPTQGPALRASTSFPLCPGSLLAPPALALAGTPLGPPPISEHPTSPLSHLEGKVAPNPPRLLPPFPSSPPSQVPSAEQVRCRMGWSSLGCRAGKEGLHFEGLGFQTGAQSVSAKTPLPSGSESSGGHAILGALGIHSRWLSLPVFFLRPQPGNRLTFTQALPSHLVPMHSTPSPSGIFLAGAVPGCQVSQGTKRTRQEGDTNS